MGPLWIANIKNEALAYSWDVNPNHIKKLGSLDMIKGVKIGFFKKPVFYVVSVWSDLKMLRETPFLHQIWIAGHVWNRCGMQLKDIGVAACAMVRPHALLGIAAATVYKFSDT